MKKRIIITLVILVLAAGGAGALFWFAGLSGSSSLEKWIGQQFQSIANSYLNPQLTFDDLDYQYPGTVSLKNMRLTADDPAHPGKKIDILGCGKATITLAEIPSIGNPILIEQIVLDEPVISAVAVAPGSNEFVGLSNLMRGQAPATRESESPSPSTPAASNRPKLSDVFRMKLVQVNKGRIVYDPRISGTKPMELDQINTALNIEPTEAGWYKFSTALNRKPVFDLSIAGQVNLDEFSTRELKVALAADLAKDKITYLPPEIQQLLNEYEVSGKLDVLVTGSLPLKEPTNGDLTTNIKLSDANVTLGEYRIPVQSLTMTPRLHEGKIDLAELKIAALEGTARVQGSAVFNDLLDSNISVMVAGMRLEKLLSARMQGRPQKFAGKLNVTLQAQAPLKVVLAKAKPDPSTAALASTALPANWGAGSINITEASLVSLPVIHKLSDSIGTAVKLIGASNLYGNKPTETATVTFDLGGDRANVTDINYVGSMIAARGNGSVFLNQNLDLKLNGGPVEKVQALLGKQIGGAIARVTDSLLSYRVTGKIGQPEINVEVAGGSASQVGKKIESGAEKVGQGLQNLGQGIGNLIKPKDGK